MDILSFSLGADLMKQLARLMRSKGNRNRSKAVREMLRNGIEAARLEQHPQASFCVASLSFVYIHRVHDLAERLNKMQHKHHELVVCTMQVYSDRNTRMATLFLRGAIGDVMRLSSTLMAQRGVQHGRVNLVPIHGEEQGGDEHNLVMRQYT